MDFLKIEHLEKNRAEFKRTQGAPFSHTSIDKLLDSDFAKKCAQDFSQIPLDRFFKYSDPDFEYNKHALNKVELMPDSLRKLFDHLHSSEFVQLIEGITGYKGLKVDEARWGGGLHSTTEGGYLAVHRDFSVLPATFKQPNQYLRTINIIGYLTEDWEEGWGGELEFWDNADNKVAQVQPRFNSWVIFDTRGSYHGHPHPYRGKSPRRSIAAYYYLEEKVDRSRWHSTQYLRLPWREDSPEYQRKREERASAELRYKSLL